MIARDGVTTLPAVPTMYEALLHHPDRGRFDVSSLETCVCGGAPLPVDVLRRFEEAFRAALREGYGLSEISSMVSINRLDRPRKPGSIGVAVGGTEVKLVDEQDRTRGRSASSGRCQRAPRGRSSSA